MHTDEDIGPSKVKILLFQVIACNIWKAILGDMFFPTILHLTV